MRITIPDTPQAGIALMAAAMMLAPFMDMFAKLLTATMSPGSIGLGRFLAQTMVLLPVLFWARQWVRPGPMHVLGGLFLGVALVSLNAALKHMPIANAIAIFFVEPLILTLMSAYLLGEGLGWRRLMAVTVGLIGALVVIRPNWELFGLASVYPLITALAFASYMLVTRVMTQRGGRVALQFWIGIFAAIWLAGFCLIGDRAGAAAFALTPPGGHELWLLAAMGLMAAISHQMIAHALARAEAGLLAPLQYLEIIAAVLIGWFVFADWPDLLTWIGATIIIGSGLYVFRRERRLESGMEP